MSGVTNIIEIARELMERHGTDAAAIMDRRSSENDQAGDRDAAAFWARVAQAIRTLESIEIGGNVDRLAKRLETEAEPGHRTQLKSLLIEEENRLGVRSEQLQIVGRRMRDCRNRIAQFESLVQQARTKGHDINPSEQLLQNLRELHDLYKDHHRVIADGLTRPDL